MHRGAECCRLSDYAPLTFPGELPGVVAQSAAAWAGPQCDFCCCWGAPRHWRLLGRRLPFASTT